MEVIHEITSVNKNYLLTKLTTTGSYGEPFIGDLETKKTYQILLKNVFHSLHFILTVLAAD